MIKRHYPSRPTTLSVERARQAPSRADGLAETRLRGWPQGEAIEVVVAILCCQFPPVEFQVLLQLRQPAFGRVCSTYHTGRLPRLLA
jgi:hypothetical protein